MEGPLEVDEEHRGEEEDEAGLRAAGSSGHRGAKGGPAGSLEARGAADGCATASEGTRAKNIGGEGARGALEQLGGLGGRGKKTVDLAAVWRDTQKHAQRLLKNGEIPPPGPALVHDFDIGFNPESYGGVATGCRIAISTDDSVTAATRVSLETGTPALVLNFASKNLPGGAVGSGVFAQEESIFRQTAISLVLSPISRPQCYPLPEGRVVVTKGIAVVKSSDYAWLPQPYFLVDIASSPAEQKPALSADGLRYADPSRMRTRAASVLQAAARAGNKNIVLGAWGCGGFRNPALGLAELWRELLLTDGYAACFESIEFAVPAEKFAVHFREAFGSVLQGPLQV